MFRSCNSKEQSTTYMVHNEREIFDENLIDVKFEEPDDEKKGFVEETAEFLS